jgi:mannitol/fructose-specific phosphotransferase system IIA component (Ntr-type)
LRESLTFAEGYAILYSDTMKLADILREDRVSTSLQGKQRREVIEELLGLLAGSEEILDHGGFSRAIEEREALESTGIGNGIGIPHGITNAVRGVVCAVGVSQKGIDYPSMDGKPVNIVFLLGVPKEEAREYLNILARICKCFRDGALKRAVLKATSPQEILKLIAERDSEES